MKEELYEKWPGGDIHIGNNGPSFVFEKPKV